MRKLIMFASALAALVVPSIASADVPRYQTQTAKFTMIQPANEYHQFANVWTHDFTVTTNPCNDTFSGTGVQTGHDGNGDYTATWDITGKFGAGNTVTFTATRADTLVLGLTNAPMDNVLGGTNGTVTIASTEFAGLPLVTPDVIEEKLSAPVFSNLSNYRNHGAYVSSVGGGSDAAHSCIGMPIVSARS
jgi:hypothetical protein